MKRIFINETINKVGEKVKVSGWVNVRRDHGKLIFIDLRDRTGLLQVVFAGQNKELWKIADALRPEWVVSIEGLIKERPENLKNPKIETGREELRMEYRYLDLRDPKMQKNLIKRSEILKFLNNYLKEQKFIEVETPVLTKGTPEGAREFVVPSRKHPGKFYVLPQSPQQFKQLLMVAGLERYFQIARCFRDEDSRGDRQPEFTQLDIEMSFVEEEDVLDLIEKMTIKLVETIFPEKKISKEPFPRMDYEEVMEKYQTDKPDLRKDKNNPNELAFAWMINMPLFEYSKTEKKLVSSHHPFTSPKNAEGELDMSQPEKIKAKA
ncbi:MAG: OB-fold nucleic acid binding domain-containing protein, partial [Candidatus Azambacteria bacterium]|nr:OB-fold nucleic acid binding domain-containing protein [Candidatus Azambacteria bacterium]